MPHNLPAITGLQFIELLQKDRWTVLRKGRHGIVLEKDKHIAVIPSRKKPLAKATLGGLLSVKQTCLGSHGLRRLIEKYGLPR